MITIITTWVTEKIVAVITVTVVAVAAVPTTLILTTEHNVTVTVTQQQLQTRTVLIQTVKTAGDELIVKLQNAEDMSLIHISEPTRPLYISYAVF